MVLTITVVGNGQNGDGSSGGGGGSGGGVSSSSGGSSGNNEGHPTSGHTVLSPNELAHLMSGQTVTGLLNPDGSITLNSDSIIPAQQLDTIQTTTSMLPTTMTTSAGPNYQQPNGNYQQPLNQVPTHATQPPTPVTNKKTGQKRLTAKQKLAQQQQQQQQLQMQQMQPDTRHIMTTQTDHQQFNQQPQIVATVQLPNGQIGQLIAPSGGQFWSPNAINLQQISMAVAAATGSMPQTMSIPAGTSSQQQTGQQVGGQEVQQQSSMLQQSDQMQQSTQQLQQSSQSLNNSSQQQQQVVSTIQLPNNQLGQVMGRAGQAQIWSGGQISLSHLSALAQQGVVQLSPVQGIPSTGPNGQRVVEMLPQSAIQGLLSQNGQPVQAISLANGGQFITQDPNDSSKWQIVPSNQVTSAQQAAGGVTTTATTTIATSNGSNVTMSRNSNNNNNNNNNSNSNSSSYNQYVDPSSQNTVLNNDNSQPNQPQRKLKRLACTCPNCRDGDNNRNNGDKKKQHICHFPDCNKVYGKTSHLRAHLRWHSGERPYVCNWSFCGKKFTRSDELQRHRRTHTGEKRFQCSECLKRFMRSDHLSKHLKTHITSKKGVTSQVTQINGIPTLVTVPTDSIKMEKESMIDDLTLDTIDETSEQAMT